eukprot:3177589-Alexandrium_andersonii.AAC.1
MTDQAIFDVQLGDLKVFRQQVIDWVDFWRPDSAAIRAMQDAPPAVICVLLSRPSGWSDCVSVSKTVSTGLRRHLAVYR